MSDTQPTDAEILAWIEQNYDKDFAERVREFIEYGDGFSDHLRQTFLREMEARP